MRLCCTKITSWGSGLLLGGLVLLLLLAGAIACCVFYQPRGAFFDSNGVRIHYSDHGAGPPVILVHGFAANSHLNWRLMGVTRALEKDFRVIALDCRGHGRSEKPHAPEAYGREMTEDVVRLMDHLGLKKAHLAGYSMGGAIAMTLAVHHPDRFWSIAGCGSGWYRHPNLINRVMQSNDSTRGWRPLLSAIIKNDPKRALLFEDVFERWVNDIRALKALGKRFGELCVEEKALRAIHVPYLAVIGTRDSNLKSVQGLRGLLPSLEEVVLIPGGSHAFTPRDPAFSEALRSFFQAHSPK